MPSRLRIAAACMLGAVAAYGAHAYAREIDLAEQDAYSADVRRVHALDAELGEHVMRARAGMTSHYDPIAQTLSQLRRVVGALEAAPAFVPSGDRGELRARVDACRDQVEAAARLVESFKSENAVLRNSVRFFPVAASALAERSREEGARVRGLLAELLGFTVLPDPAFAKRAQEQMQTLGAVGWSSTRDADDAKVLLSHARVILDRKPKVDDLTQRVLAVPVASAAVDLERTYARVYRTAVEDVSRRRSGLFFLVLLTVALFAADIVVRTKRSAQALREASQKLQSALDTQKDLNMLKSRFVSMASHEFRTPLSAILSSAELLAAYGERWPSEKKAEHFTRIEKAVRGMADMLDRILVIGRSDAGLLEFKPAKVDLARLCGTLVEACGRLAGEGRTVDFDYCGPEEEALLDEKLLNHVLSNLLSNAIKYSEGAVRFRVTRFGGDIVFRIEDDGIGIPEADLPHLFESFHRGRNVAKISGTGLGLAIVKRSVDLHGGTIEVSSKVDKGTVFVVRLPEGKA